MEWLTPSLPVRPGTHRSLFGPLSPHLELESIFSVQPPGTVTLCLAHNFHVFDTVDFFTQLVFVIKDLMIFSISYKISFVASKYYSLD